MPLENNLTSSVPLTRTPKIGKFKASKIIVRESWDILKQDKEIVWFPIMSTICTLLAMAIMVAIFYFFLLDGNLSNLEIKDDGTSEGDLVTNLIYYGGLLVWYTVMFFIVNFFEAGLFVIVQGRFSGKNLNFSDGMGGAQKHFGRILVWSLISATVGVILRIISDKSRIIGKIVSSLLGAAWIILTYFSLPALVIGDLGIRASFKESASMIRKTWGETIIINFGAGIFFALILFFWFVFSVGLAVVIPSIFIFVVVLFIAGVIVLSVLYSTLNSIFKLALFNYARTGEIPKGFSAELVKEAIVAK